MMKSVRSVKVFGVVFVLSLCAVPVRGTIYPFEIFTSNGNYWDDPGVDLYVDVTGDADSVDFTFYNDSTVESCIASVYFDDGSLFASSNITNGPGTMLSSEFPGPENLPGGAEIGFYADSAFSVGASSPAPVNGVNPGEWFTITFTTAGGDAIGSVIDELNTGTLRVGLHVIAFADDSSESAVPEPATVLLLGLGTMLLRSKR